MNPAAAPAELAHRYAVALDLKDFPTLVDLFLPHVRPVIQEQVVPAVAELGVTVLSVTTQVVDEVDPDHATGTVYCTAEIEHPELGWIRQSIVYLDRYERLDGEWYFHSRDHQLVYGEQLDSNPLDQPEAHWPESPIGTGTYPPRS